MHQNTHKKGLVTCILITRSDLKQMKTNIRSKKSIKHQFKIPAKKLPDTLAQEVCNPFWKKIINSIENGEVKPIIEVINLIDKCSDSPCLPHPFVKDIDTYPTKSIRQGMCNFLFFSDSLDKNQWILCQRTSFVDAIFSATYSGKHKSSAGDDGIISSIKRVLKKVEKKNRTKDEANKATFAGYLLDQKRPYHHFYDQLKWMVHLETKKPVVSNSSFFTPRYLNISTHSKKKNSNSFSMFPAVIGSNQLGMKLDQYTEKMEKVVYQDSFKGLYTSMIGYQFNQAIKNIKNLWRNNKTFTLWYGISGQKRIWVEQEDFLPALVEQLNPWFDSFVFLIDGFTQYEDSRYSLIQGSKETSVNQDIEVINSIQKKLLPYAKVSVNSLVGQTYRNKIQHCSSVDFFIANAGAGQLVPHRFCKKPGILHSNGKHCVFPTGIDNTTVRMVERSNVKDVGNLFARGRRAETSGSGLISYSIDIQTMIKLTLEMLELHNKKD